jgi:O-antigen/teichoic acid export membrane protein
MTLLARLARNSLWLLTARIGAQVCAVIVTYLLARRLSLAEFGEYSFIAAAILIGNVLTTFGSDMYLIREIAAKDDLSLLSPALSLQLILSVVFIVFIFAVSPRLPNQISEGISALRIYCFALIPLAFFTVFTSALRGRQKMGVYASLNLTVSILQVVAIWIFMQSGSGIVTLAYLLLVIQSAGTVAAGIFCSTSIPGFWGVLRIAPSKMTRLFIACFPIAVIAALGIVYQKLTLTLLSLLGSASLAGLFSASARVVEAARMGHFAALTALYPAMANENTKKDSLITFKYSFQLLLLASCALVAVLYFLAIPIMEIFFGENYQSSAPVLRVLSFTLLPYAINSYLSLRFLVEKREKELMRATFLSLIILLLSNLWLIPRAGVLGAGWASLISEIIQLGLLWFEWRSKRIPFHKGASHELSDPSRQI